MRKLRISTKIQNKTTRNIVTGVASTALGLGGAALAVTAVAALTTNTTVKGAVGLVSYCVVDVVSTKLTRQIITPKDADSITAEDLVKMYPHLFQEEDLVDKQPKKETPKETMDRLHKENTSVFKAKPLSPEEAFNGPEKPDVEQRLTNIRVNSSPTVQQLSEILEIDTIDVMAKLLDLGFKYEELNQQVANTNARYLCLDYNINLIFY